jgi:hypothetical protein
VGERKALDRARRRALARLRKASTFGGRPASHATNSISDRYFVDTNLLVYARDAAAGEKHRRAKALVEELWETRAVSPALRSYRNWRSICAEK